MVRTFMLRLPGTAEVKASLEKFQRSDLYGYKIYERRDEAGSVLAQARITWDGQHIIPDKGATQIFLDEDKNYVPSADIYDVDKEGEPLQEQPSSYKIGIDLENTITIDEFFTHNFETTYTLSSLDDPASLLLIQVACEALLRTGKLYTFKYAYLDSYYPQDAVIIPHDGDLVVAIGKRFELRWIGPATDVEELFKDIEEEDEEEISFGEVW